MSSTHQLTDLFTKRLPHARFHELTSKLNLHCIPNHLRSHVESFRIFCQSLLFYGHNIWFDSDGMSLALKNRNPPMAGTSHSTPKTFPVILHVYDVSHFNYLLRTCGSGFYRSAIEVHGVEYMFLDCLNDNGEETARLLAGNPSRYATINKGLKLHQSIVIGRTNRSNDEADQGIRDLPPIVYHHVQNNSHHFAERVSDLLVGNTRGIQSLQWLRRCDPLENQFGFLKLMVRNNMLNVNEQLTATFPVVLNVYKVPCGTMRKCFGSEFSFYRSSVEVHGVEYMFCEHDGVAGIAMTTPQHLAGEKGLELEKSIMMGRTDKNNADQVKTVVEMVGNEGKYGVYPRNLYNYISKNCHHFSDDLCFALVGKHIPGWNIFLPFLIIVPGSEERRSILLA